MNPLVEDVVHGLIRFGEGACVRTVEAEQRFANRPMSFGQPELDAASETVATQRDQQLGAGEVDVRDVAHEQNDQLKGIRPLLQQR